MYEEDAYLLKLIVNLRRLKIINEIIKHKTLHEIQLTKILGIRQSTTSQHLSKMRGIILNVERNGVENYYQISNEKMVQIFKGLRCLMK
ncbi:ArsR/SmtB family transcription factor [Bacillus toyonensis]|uniref:ArsR/SmtB family transcription factor n=1 Tax=Bacillus toyonensis TaxID=155322 RepID=UPI0025419087|nr:ArsR family transcriptional regulator [Bacillus toyonensis]WIG34247.1 ArsR family transcriptional regulator [Bacillus toyonensis]